MKFIQFIQENLDWLSSDPLKVATVASTSLILGWALAKLFYKERIELLKEKQNPEKPSSSEPDLFEYPQTGNYGKNILSRSVTSIKKNETVALRAQFPEKSSLMIEIKGLKSLHGTDSGGFWHFTHAKKLNWTAETYESENGGRQEFTAETGIADMALTFARDGEVAIVAYEGNGRNFSWEKTITIRE